MSHVCICWVGKAAGCLIPREPYCTCCTCKYLMTCYSNKFFVLLQLYIIFTLLGLLETIWRLALTTIFNIDNTDNISQINESIQLLLLVSEKTSPQARGSFGQSMCGLTSQLH